jgi:hypothetical protein
MDTDLHPRRHHDQEPSSGMQQDSPSAELAERSEQSEVWML